MMIYLFNRNNRNIFIGIHPMLLKINLLLSNCTVPACLLFVPILSFFVPIYIELCSYKNRLFLLFLCSYAHLAVQTQKTVWLFKPFWCLN